MPPPIAGSQVFLQEDIRRMLNTLRRSQMMAMRFSDNNEFAQYYKAGYDAAIDDFAEMLGIKMQDYDY